MMIYDRIKALCKREKISVNKLEEKLDISKGSLCKIDINKPSAEKMQKIADFFSVTVESLTTGEEQSADSSLSELDGVYLSLAREAQQSGIDPDDVRVIIETIKSLKRARGE